jgi:hypothetical protein
MPLFYLHEILFVKWFSGSMLTLFCGGGHLGIDIETEMLIL